MVLTSTGFLGINTIRPVVETHIVHGFGSITHDLQISHVSLGTDHYWNLYTEIGGALELAADGNIVGLMIIFSFLAQDKRGKKTE